MEVTEIDYNRIHGIYRICGNVYDTNSANRTAGTSGSSSMDTKIDWLVKTIKKLKEEIACKREVKMMIREVHEEMGNIKQELEDLRRIIHGEANRPVERFQRSYSNAIKEKKKEDIIIIKPKIQQESEATKKLI